MLIRFIIPILGLGLVIAFHELGHLFMAKFLKIKVDVFSVGIGKKLFSIKKSGTEYAISLIPLGGYCKLKGGDLQNPNLDADSMDIAHPFKKILIYIAGPLFNIVLASIIMTIFYIIPAHTITPTEIIPIVGQNYPAELAGLKKGDKIISIDNVLIEDFNDISTSLKSNNNIRLKIKRENQTLTINLTPKNIDGRAFIGIYPFIPLEVLKTSPLTQLNRSDIITAIDGFKVDNYYDLLKLIDSRENFKITVLRDNKLIDINYSYRELIDTSFTQIKTFNIFEAVKMGISDTYLMLDQIIIAFAKLFKSGEIKNQISSPIGLVYQVGNSIDNIYSVQNKLFTLQIILSIISSISLTLGFINLFPIPILDGGQILINIITIIKRNPIKPSILIAYQTVGLIIVLLLFVLGINNDIFSILENK